jgi:hypothetical protein
MPKPNYAFEKRQRELAKKQKKEEKLMKRSSQQTGSPEDESVEESPAAPAVPDGDQNTP